MERALQVAVGHELAHIGQDKATVKRAVEFFRGAKDAEYRAMLEDVAREYGYDLGTIRGYADAVREATARYAERGETGRLWDVVKTEVRFALRKLGLKLKYTDADLRGIVASMMRNADAKIRGGLGDRAIRFMVGKREGVERRRDKSITPEIARQISRQSGEIRLDEGYHDSKTGKGEGRAHIQASHGEELRSFGYKFPDDFVDEVATSYEQIYKGTGRSLILVKQRGKNRIAVVELSPGAEGKEDYYRVKTAYVARPDFFKNKKPLWDGAQSHQSTEGEPLSAVSGRKSFSDSNIPPSGEDGKTRFSLKDLRETAGEDVPFSRHQNDPPTQENIRRGNVAMDKVISEKTDVVNAMSRDDLGEVSFYWGKPGDPSKKYAGGKGVSHIIAQRGEEMARKMVEVIAKGKVTRSYGPPYGERAWISHKGHTAVLSLFIHRNRASWLLTGWKDDAPDVRGAFHEADAPTLSEPTLARPREGAEASVNIHPSPAPRKNGVTAESIRADLANHPLKCGLVILQSVNEIPDAVKRAAERKGAALDNIEGFTHGGKAYVIADNVGSGERARQVALGHELVHLGQDRATVKRAVEFFRGTKDAEYRAMLEEIARPDNYDFDLNTIKGYADAVREATAQYAERGETGRLWDVVKTEVRFALRKLGLKLKYTDADLRGIVASMMRNADAKIRGGLGERAIKFMVGDSFKGKPEKEKGLPREASTFREAFNKASEFVNKPLENRATSMTATISGRTLSKMLSASAAKKSVSPEAHSMAVANIDHLFQGAELEESLPDRDGDVNIKAVHRFTTPMPHKGDILNARMLVKEFKQTSDGNRIYTVETVEIEKPARNWAPSISADKRRIIAPHAGSSDSNIPPSGEDGKPFSLKKDQTETGEFKRWFGDSKVVDEDGKPLVVYHGTAREFYIFDKDIGGTSSRGGAGTDRGFFFSNNYSHANYWGEQAGIVNKENPRIMEAYLKLENPYIVDFEEMSLDEQAYAIDVAITHAYDNDNDGVIIKNIPDDDTMLPQNVFIAFSPTQIKSATGNRGTFDTENPDIRFSLKDLRETAEDVQKTLKTIVTPVKGHEGDAGGFLAQVLASPEWIDHDGIQKIVQHNLERSETRHEIHYDISTDDNGESIIGKMDKLNKVQLSILSAVTTWADERVWNAMPVDKIMNRTERELKDRGANPETVAVWRDMRDGYDRGLWRMLQPMIELRDEIRGKGEL